MINTIERRLCLIAEDCGLQEVTSTYTDRIGQHIGTLTCGHRRLVDWMFDQLLEGKYAKDPDGSLRRVPDAGNRIPREQKTDLGLEHLRSSARKIGTSEI